VEEQVTFKEWTAIVQLAGVVAVGVWLALDTAGGGAAGDVAAVATKLLWAVGAAIVFNIVAMIGAIIIGSIIQGEEIKDEADDERDRQVTDRSLRNSSVVQSLAAAAGLFVLAFGGDPVLGAYALFVAPFLGGTVDAASRLLYYRLG
jgi:hypothetical protein